MSGALLQFRLVSKQLSVSVYADRAVAEAVAKDHAAVIAQYESLIAGKSSGKGTMLSTGLPAYPASQNKSSSEKSQSSSSGRASVKKQGNDKESLDGEFSYISFNCSEYILISYPQCRHRRKLSRRCSQRNRRNKSSNLHSKRRPYN